MAFAEILPDSLGTSLVIHENGGVTRLASFNAAGGITTFDWKTIESMATDPDPEKNGPANILLAARKYGRDE